MKAFGLNELREMFLSFFESKGHLRLPSFSLVPQNDPSLLLINSGMAPLKPYFTGEQIPPRRRVCTCQKCVRTGDIDNIGKTARHGTFFEMLGNFSFGDYFKHEAIAWCWEFLTSPDWVGMDPDRLYPSVFEDDDEAFAIWRDEIGIPPERIFRFGREDNFWEHGTGACGPCSEVYYDRGEKYGCGKPDCTVGCDCDRYIEVWNNVFSQFNSDGQGHYTELAHKNIDTGMGLERLACVCQDVPSLFDVDTVMNITHKVSELTGAHYGESQKADVSLRVITDHIRSATFLIGDGVLPSNEGRGYVLRRLLRRAARHGKLLGVNEPFLYKVCETVIHENRTAYPDLVDKQSFITRVIKTEEESFARTIDGGMKILSELMDGLKAKGETVLSGEDTFRLYDTYGFPLDLTEDILSDAGMTADTEGFDKLMTEQRERARAARGDISGWAGLDLGLDNVPTEFTGYDTLSDTGTVEALIAAGELSGELGEGTEGSVVLDKTPFYAEMGGQVADHGVITGEGGAEFTVTDVQKTKGGKYLHTGTMTRGSFHLGENVQAVVDAERRTAIMRAHSATHLLHAALRRVLGDHVHQAGSLVEPDRLRFDFTHFSAMTGEELLEVARIVNHEILAGDGVSTEVMDLEAARARGAQALFGEKYGESVRVVTMGGFSSELCGGTHVDNTAKVGPFRIESEFSVASGVRRIEAVTGLEFFRENEENNRKLLAMADMLKTSPNEVVEKARAALDNLREMRRRVDALQDKIRSGEIENFITSGHAVGALKVVTVTIPETGGEDMRRMGDFLREREPGIVAVLASVKDGKITFLAVCGKDAVAAGVKAGDIIRQVTALTGGKGGGKPDSAMGGGHDLLMLDNALAMVDNFVAMKLGLSKE
ncbi:MAG TPA: alanine--tRNA ligase [Candidatus Scatomorpha gallistercoris]|nr:alanine--tRNA ligase [Candidatus Scatomorpha gallistercoris]